jgi:Protein of unknown function C-terminal (DUF3324)
MTGRLHTLRAMPGRVIRMAIGIAVGTALLATLPAVAGAKGATFSITPTNRAPYFVFNSSGGSVIRGTARVVNVSSVAGRASLYPVDATTGQTSGAVYESRGAPRNDVGAWIKLAASTLSLGPHKGADVSFSVTVPSGIRGGQHLGGLVVAPTQATATSTTKRGSHSFHVNIEEIAVVAVQVNLPGALTPKVAITGVRASGRPGYQTLLVSLANAGNQLVKGSGKIQVSRGGKQILSQSFPLDTMVPQTSIDYPVYVHGSRLPPGQYTASVTIPYTGSHVAHGVFTFGISSGQVRQTYGSTVPAGGVSSVSGGSSSFPVWGIALGAVVLVGASIGGSAWFFRRRSPQRQA